MTEAASHAEDARDVRAEALRPDRLELGEGIRWTERGLVLVDILAGRLLIAPDNPIAPLKQLAQLPVPLGAVAPLPEIPVPGSPLRAPGSACSPPTDRRGGWHSRKRTPHGPCA